MNNPVIPNGVSPVRSQPRGRGRPLNFRKPEKNENKAIIRSEKVSVENITSEFNEMKVKDKDENTTNL